KEHLRFKQEHDDLYIEHNLNLTEALYGFQFVVTYLDGRQLLIKSNLGEVIKPGLSLHQVQCGFSRLRVPFSRPMPIIRDDITSKIQLTDMELDECEETTLHH
ncbi:hypothetical protein S245_063233, partial [Arachis hypogaea]